MLALGGVFALAVAARTAAVRHWYDDLSRDRDVYLALAAGLAEERGYSIPGTTTPTAYRPPLYPLVLVPVHAASAASARGLLHGFLGVATVGLTCVLGRRLGLGPGGVLLAAVLVSVDPLLVRYTASLMTETLATFLGTLLLVTLTPRRAPTPSNMRTVVGRRLRWWANAAWTSPALAGVVLGLCVLCRPTFLAFGLLLALGMVLAMLREQSSRPRDLGRRLCRARAGHGAVMLIAAALTVAPWVARNWWVLGAPVLTTTHGGYTLLLANNEVYYREVVEGTGEEERRSVWQGEGPGGQVAWADGLNREMDALGISGEIARDRWMSGQAWNVIRRNPQTFVRASLLRLRRFWAIAPLSGETSPVPDLVRGGVMVFFAGTFAAAAIGLGFLGRCVGSRRRRVDARPACRADRGAGDGTVPGRHDTPLDGDDFRAVALWGPPVLLVASLVCVHLLYWTDARMRAPVVPVVCLLAAWGLERLLESLRGLTGRT
jgi:hypothetical protein